MAMGGLWVLTIAAGLFLDVDAWCKLLLVALLFTILVLALTWYFLRRQLAVSRHIAAQLSLPSAGTTALQIPAANQSDELRDLVGRYNHLIETLAQRDEALAQSEHRFRTAFLAMPEAISITRLSDGLYREVNDDWLRLSRRTRDEVIGKTSAELDIWRNPADRERFAKGMLSDRQVDNLEADFVTKEGVVVRGLLSARFVHFEGEPCILAITRDITARKHLEEQVRRMAFFDPLTELPNRRLLDDRLAQAIIASKRSARCSALLFLDLDKFKLLNDGWGHQAGDLLLIEVARRLCAQVREVDTVARLGGDEFVVLLQDLQPEFSASTELARSVAQKIWNSLTKPYWLQLQSQGKPTQMFEHQCSASIGVVVFSGKDANADDILKRADMAMYDAKKSGTNSIRIHEHQSGTTVD